MNDLFPGEERRVHFEKIELNGTPGNQWEHAGLDMRANVVCRDCNNTWMSDIEYHHAKPSMSDLILGNQVEEITAARARSISLFAFKTAVITNHMLPEDEEFFDISQRYAFRESLSIPPKVGMYLLGFPPENAGGIRSTKVCLSFPGTHVQAHFTDNRLRDHHIDAVDARQIHSGDALQFIG
jgi:hypothetical protein